MTLSAKAKNIHSQISDESTKRGDIKKIAKEIKKDHDLGMELWSIGEFNTCLLAVLILDKKLLTQEFIDGLEEGMQSFSSTQKNHIMEWLMANQLMKSKEAIALIESWENSHSSLQRRTFWYHQARLRWAGQTPPDNTEYLLSQIESRIMEEEPEVQWTMNFLAAWIGIFEEKYRKRCIKLGEKTGLYKEEKAVKGCTPSYLPEFIRIEVAKRK